MSWFKNRKLKKRFLALVAKAKPFEFTDMLGRTVEIKLQGDPSLGNFTISLEDTEIDCNNKVRTIKASKYIPSGSLNDFDSYYDIIKMWMTSEIEAFNSLYKEEMGYKNDLQRLKQLNLENCIHREANTRDEYVRSYMLSDFKRAMLYLQALKAEDLFYLDEYKKYIFDAFKGERDLNARRYEKAKTPITADEPTARYDHYSKWLISYQKVLDNIAREKEIESKVENLDKLLEEVNQDD